MINPREWEVAVCEATAAVIARSGLSSYAISKRSGLTTGGLSLIQSGRRVPSPMAIAKIELAIGVRGAIYEDAAKRLRVPVAV